MRRHLVATAILATAALLTACSGGAAGPAATSGSTASSDPTEGGDLTVLIGNFDAGWAPSKSSISSYEGNVWGHITDKLVYVDPEGTISPWIAESWEQNETATEFTLHLKDGVTFSDGTPLDAAAVVANIDSWAKGDTARGITRIALFPSASYDHAEAVDATTVKVVFTAPTLGFIPTLGYHGSILIAPSSIALPLEEQGDLSKEIGSGPFTVEEWSEGDKVVLTRRADYDWGPEAIGHTGAPYLDSLTYKIVQEDTLRSSAVQSGQADVAFNISPQEIDALRAGGFTVETPRYLGFAHGFKVSTKAPPFDDVRVRQAVQHGIDREEIIATVYTEDWLPAETFIQSSVPEASDHTDAFAFEPDEAEQLLDDAGWEKGADGVRTKDGQPLSLTLYPTPYLSTSQPVDELIAQQLTDIGFTVDLQTLDVPTYLDKMKANPAIALSDVTRSFIDVGTVGGVLTSKNKGENWFFVDETDTTLNDLSAGIASAADRDTRAALVDELQAYVLEQAYFIPVTQINQRLYLQSPTIHGTTFNGLAYANYTAAWLD